MPFRQMYWWCLEVVALGPMRLVDEQLVLHCSGEHRVSCLVAVTRIAEQSRTVNPAIHGHGEQSGVKGRVMRGTGSDTVQRIEPLALAPLAPWLHVRRDEHAAARHP